MAMMIGGLDFDVWASPDVFRDEPGVWAVLDSSRRTVIDVRGSDDVRAAAWAYEESIPSAIPGNWWHAAHYTAAASPERAAIADGIRARCGPSPLG